MHRHLLEEGQVFAPPPEVTSWVKLAERRAAELLGEQVWRPGNWSRIEVWDSCRGRLYLKVCHFSHLGAGPVVCVSTELGPVRRQNGRVH